MNTQSVSIRSPKPRSEREEPAPAEPRMLITEEDRKELALILSDSSNYFIQYVREENRIAIDRDKKGNFIAQKIVRGAPIGAIVAICQETSGNNTVALGWSKRHAGVIENDAGEKIGNVEPLPFTKKSARRCAILRALADGVVLKEGNNNIVTEDGAIVPKSITRNIPRFLEKTKRYFGEDCKIYNVQQ